jgi:glycosyltransferase involved in cell wall biosynthesis
MKILYLNSGPFNSEMANLRQVKAMCYAMAESNFDITLSLPGVKPDNYKKPNYKIDFRKQYTKGKFDRYISVYPLLKSIKKENPDILYIRDSVILTYAYLFSRRDIIFESHNNSLHEGIPILNRFLRWLLKKGLFKRRVIKLVTISHALKEYWVNQGIPSEKITAVHDGVDVKMFGKKKSKLLARKELSLPTDKIIVSYTGRLYADRKIENIITLASKFNNILFLVVGGPNENAQLYRNEALKMQLSNILFTGQVKQPAVSDYLAASDILLALWSSEVPTINYCSPLKLFEYMAANRVILAHGFPTIKEVLIDKVDALLVKPDDTNDLINKLDEALNLSKPEVLADNAYEKAVNEYTWSKRVEQIFIDI